MSLHRPRSWKYPPARQANVSGRSMIIDPWVMLAQAQDMPTVTMAEIDPTTRARAQIPRLSNRRPEVYRLIGRYIRDGAGPAWVSRRFDAILLQKGAYFMDIKQIKSMHPEDDKKSSTSKLSA